MKQLFIVSTGRCGTKRLSEILDKYTGENYEVRHQVKWSRVSNVLGNIMLVFGNVNFVKKVLINKIISNKDKSYITTDPLVSLVIPNEMIISNDVAIIHVVRDHKSFGRSFYQFTRKKAFSFIAHNFIPFWQPKVYPFENLIKGKKIISKYEKVGVYKEQVFEEKYSMNPNYIKFRMEDVFEGEKVLQSINLFFKDDINVPHFEFDKKSNQSI